MNKRSRHLATGLALLTLSSILQISVVFAADIPIETYVEGGLTIDLNGDFASDMTFASILLPMDQDVIREWDYSSSVDFIAIADDTATAGSYLTIDMTDFVYTGRDHGSDIVASNFKIMGNYPSQTPAAVTKGLDDPSYNLSILPTSHPEVTTSMFTFHSDLTSGREDYTLTGSTTEQILVESTANRLAIVNIRLEHSELTIPQASAEGDYTTSFTYVLVDGASS